jgi:hypothetical protein
MIVWSFDTTGNVSVLLADAGTDMVVNRNGRTIIKNRLAIARIVFIVIG